MRRLLISAAALLLLACEEKPDDPPRPVDPTPPATVPGTQETMAVPLPDPLPDDPVQLVSAVYTTLASSNWNQTPDARRIFTPELYELRKAKTIFFDEFTNSQDPAPYFRVDPAHEKDGRFEVPVAFDFNEKPKGEPELRVVVTRTPAGLRIDDFLYGESTLRGVLEKAQPAGAELE